MIPVGLTMEIRVGKKRTIVIPKAVAEVLGIDEGSKLLLEVKEGYMVLKPVPDAIYLSLYGEKIARTSLKELEETSVEEQKRYIEKPEILIDTSFLLPALGIEVEKKSLTP